MLVFVFVLFVMLFVVMVVVLARCVVFLRRSDGFGLRSLLLLEFFELFFFFLFLGKLFFIFKLLFHFTAGYSLMLSKRFFFVDLFIAFYANFQMITFVGGKRLNAKVHKCEGKRKT